MRRNEQKKSFTVELLEGRMAPAPLMVLIPSVDLDDPAVNGAEHACPGLNNAFSRNGNESVRINIFRHGCSTGGE